MSSSLLTNLFKNVRLLSNVSTKFTNTVLQRNLFGPAALGIENFQKSQKVTEETSITNINTYRKRFEDALKEQNPIIFTDDLKSSILLIRNDKELDLFIKALKIYTQSKLSTIDYRFGPQLMRLLYIMNKTDLAMSLINDDSFLKIFNDHTSSVILASKLYDEGRYNDVVRLFDKYSQNESAKGVGKERPFYSQDLIKVLIASLYQLNTAEAFNLLKNYCKIFNETNIKLSFRSNALACIMSIKQNDFNFAYQLVNSFEASTNPVVANLKAIILAGANRVDDALNVLQRLQLNNRRDLERNPNEKSVFPMALKYVKESIEKTKNKDLENRYDIINKDLLNSNLIHNIDLPDYCLEKIAIRSVRRLDQNRFNQNDQSQVLQQNDRIPRFQNRYSNRNSQQVDNRYSNFQGQNQGKTPFTNRFETNKTELRNDQGNQQIVRPSNLNRTPKTPTTDTTTTTTTNKPSQTAPPVDKIQVNEKK